MTAQGSSLQRMDRHIRLHWLVVKYPNIQILSKSLDESQTRLLVLCRMKTEPDIVLEKRALKMRSTFQTEVEATASLRHLFVLSYELGRPMGMIAASRDKRSKVLRLEGHCRLLDDEHTHRLVVWERSVIGLWDKSAGGHGLLILPRAVRHNECSTRMS